MKKLKKMDTKAGQTVYSFKCPCGACVTICPCDPNAPAGLDARTGKVHEFNASHGGSATGGAGM